MKNHLLFCLSIMILFSISCKKQDKGTERNPENEVEVVEENLNSDTSIAIDKAKIVNQIQGKWREAEYPYRTAEFNTSAVKFVEEGMATVKFEKFEIGEACKFDNNNIKDLQSGSVILSLPESSRCEILNVSDDTLTLSGYSSNTSRNYSIVYLKVKS